MHATEWLESNKTGSFVLGTKNRIPIRKYQSLLTMREPGTEEPLNVLAEVGESISVGENTFLLHNFNYQNVIYPRGFEHLTSFRHQPRPCWTYTIGKIKIFRTLDLDQEKDIVRVFYSVEGISSPIIFRVEPLLTCRPWHQLTHENPFLDGNINKEKEGFSLQPYKNIPRLYMKILGETAEFSSRGHWHKNVFYQIEAERGYDSHEDIYSPGALEIKLTKDAKFSFHFGEKDSKKSATTVSDMVEQAIVPGFSPSEFKTSAEKFLIVKKSGAHSIIAGYPWFEDWDRDTMISLPGLCLSTGKKAFALEILKNYAKRTLKQVVPSAPVVSGVAQNIMVDAPLLFIRALELYSSQTTKNGELKISAAKMAELNELMPAVLHILNAFKNKLDPRVEVAANGLFYVKPGAYASTWMDVVIDGQPLTPRNGFAVDLNALFYNAVAFTLKWAKAENQISFIREWEPILTLAKDSFIKYFWNESKGYLADSHDGTHADFSLRPNQLWATALPESPLTTDMAKKILSHVKNNLVTPVGLRTLSPQDPRYKSHYRGDQRTRDSAYHQGAVWPWLLGIYADSLFKYLGSDTAKIELNPIMQRLENHFLHEGCLGQIAEIFDAEEPFNPNGTPAQAWSLAETIRVFHLLNTASKKETTR